MALPAALFGPPDGRSLVALHGFLGRGADWAGVAELLPGYRVLAPDLPGHGDALGLPGGAFSIEGTARAVLATLDAHHVEGAALVGYSMGGRLALFLALHAPRRFTHLVLESASPGLRSDEERAARRDLDAHRAAEIAENLPAFLDAWYRQPLFAATPPAVRARLARERAANRPLELARSLAGMGTGAQPSLWPALARLAVPTLALAGAEDARFAALAHELAALSGEITVHVVPGAGHTVHLDAPHAFAAAVRAFVG